MNILFYLQVVFFFFVFFSETKNRDELSGVFLFIEYRR